MQKLYSLKKLDEIGQGDQEFVKGMLVTFVENVTASIGQIKSLRMNENWVNIAEIAHKLASNFAYLDSKILQEIADNIEKSVLNEKDLTGIADKTDKLCNDAILLVEQLKNDFEFLRTV